MWSSEACNKKHTHLFHCDDQRSQNHKKNFHGRKKSNNFVIREVPMHKLFNVNHCTNASGDMSNFIKGNNSFTIDYNMPELVVFIQEDHQQYVKDICIDREVLPKGKYRFDHNMKRRSDLNLGIVESSMSNNSFGSECVFQQLSFKDAMKMHDFRNWMMKSEVEVDSGDKISIDQHLTKRTTSLTLREAFKRERNNSRSFENWQINSILGTSGSRAEFPHCKDFLQVNDSNMYRHDINYLQTQTSSGKTQIDIPEETSNSVLDSQSGQTSCIGHAKTSSFASHQSNDSISSVQSFAFPILPVEWSGSPVRMMEADKSQSRKYRWRKLLFPCCDFDD